MADTRWTTWSACAVGGGLWGLLALPPSVDLLEAHLVTHAGVQIPLLAAAGAALGAALPERVAAAGGWNERGAAGLVVATSAALLWMLPRAMDAALADPRIDAAKLAGVPLAVGIPLGASWRRLGPVARAFVLANLVSMLAALAWLYHAAPVRVCNAYLREDQLALSRFLLTAAIGITVLCSAPLFVRDPAARIARFVGRSRGAAGRREREIARHVAEGLARNLD